MVVIEDVYDLCVKFDPNLRPTAMQVLRTVSSEESLVTRKLRVSQRSAVEQADPNFALNFNNIIKNSDKHQIPPQNDGTNACTLLAISIGDAFMQEVVNRDGITLEYLVQVAEKAITNRPPKISDHRDFSKMYDPSEAKLVLEQNKLLGSSYDLSEECISANGVFSNAGGLNLSKL